MTYYIAEIRFNRGKNSKREGKMRKRLIFRLITLLLISLLFSASIMIVSVLACRKPPNPEDWKDCDWEDWEEKEPIIESLLELSSEISELPKEAFKKPSWARHQRKVLRWKVHAAIWQVAVGAYEGALNKLINDIRERIERWIRHCWQGSLIEKVDYIIELLEKLLCIDKKPPTIVSVLRFPETPNYHEPVTIIAQVIDEESGVESVILSYQVNSASWINVTMDLNDGLYVAEIPPQPYDTTVSYKVYAYDKADNLAISETYSYVVIDSYPPIISSIEHVPASPNYNETVTVFANVTEPPEASGVKKVTLFYKTNGDWQLTEMTLKANLYTGIIPAFPYETVVRYKIRAFDNAGNWADSDVYSYPVADTYLPLARIDEPAYGSYLAGVVSVEVYVYDDNFDRAELRIKDTIVMQWTSTGPHVFNWNTSTPEYPDGVYIIQLTAYDLAGNFDEETIAVILDNTPPLIGVPTWEPEEPLAHEEVEVSVWVSASGVKNVTLWYRTDDEWYFLEMVMPNGLWTATIPGQSVDVNVKFYIEAYDNVGNGAKTPTYNYTVKAPPNLPPEAKFSESAEIVYTGETVTFDASESYDPDGTIISYYWDFGDRTNATGVVVEHAYSNNGNYVVTLTVTDDDGATATATATKYILNRPPVADFTESAETVYTGEVITFDASSSHDPDGTITSYFWDFGDGTNATGVTVDHAYTDDGVYIVTLTVIDDDGLTANITSTKTVLNRPPLASFTENAKTVLTGEVIHFDASSSEDQDGSIISYLWDFGDETTAVGVKVNHAYEDDGVYTVTLTVIDDDGATASTSAVKTVSNRPPVAYFTENATIVKKGEVIHFDASESHDPDGYIVSYFWDFGDGTNATDVTVDHAYGEDGNYTVTLTVTDDDGASWSVNATKTVEKEVAGWPLALVAAIGLGIAALTATLLYGLYRRRKKRGTASNPGKKPIVTLYVPRSILSRFEIK